MHTRQSVAAVPQNKINLSKTIVESTLIALDRMRSRGLPEDTIEQLDLLPFVATSSSDGDRFWKVETTGDYCLDVELGQAYGSIYLQYSQMGGDLSLYWIIESMEFTGTNSAKGVAVGFLDEILTYAFHTARKSDVVHTYEQGSKRRHDAMEAIWGGVLADSSRPSGEELFGRRISG